MTDDTYNGWTNYETWSVALILNNDEASQENTLRLVAEVYNDWQPNPLLHDFYNDPEDGAERRRAAAVADAADELRDQIGDAVASQVRGDDDRGPTDGAPMIALQLLESALDRVDWHEVARAFLESNPYLNNDDEDDEEATP